MDGTEYGLKDLPHSERNKFTIRKNSAAVEVVLDNSVKIKYDGNHRAIICVPNDCGRNLTGVCGNFDGLPWNDLRTKSGKMAADTKFKGHEELGDSWKIDPTYGNTKHISNICSGSSNCSSGSVIVLCLGVVNKFS